MEKNPKVIVIGAGIAGLTTAYRLHLKGIDVEVYEARNRVGGRILTVYVGGHISELGAQNISDGGEAENLLRLIKDCNLELTENQLKLNQSYFDGEKLTPIRHLQGYRQFDPKALRNRLDELTPKCKNMQEVLDQLLEEKDLFYKIVSTRLTAYEGASPEKLSPLYAETLYHMLTGGTPLVQQENWEEDTVSLVSVKGGNTLLLERMAETLGSRVHLNMTLARISQGIDSSFTLTFVDGQKIKAEILVLAIPCSVYEDIIFDENIIAPDRLEAIRNVQYGKNAKILVPFSSTPSKRTQLINNNIRHFFDDQTIAFFDTTHRVLTLYYTGELSYFSMTTILHTYNQSKSMLEMGLGEAAPTFVSPQFAKDEAFAMYDSPVGYSWPNDPYIKGSYSFIAPGQESLLTTMHEENGEVVKALFAPIAQRLYFAGEHASILLDVTGTMENAAESGERTARMILNTLLRTSET